MDRESFFGAQTSSPSVEVKKYHTPFTRYNRLSNRLYNRFDNRLYTQCIRLSNRLSNGFDNRLNVCIHDTTGFAGCIVYTNI